MSFKIINGASESRETREPKYYCHNWHLLRHRLHPKQIYHLRIVGMYSSKIIKYKTYLFSKFFAEYGGHIFKFSRRTLFELCPKNRWRELKNRVHLSSDHRNILRIVSLILRRQFKIVRTYSLRVIPQRIFSDRRASNWIVWKRVFEFIQV